MNVSGKWLSLTLGFFAFHIGCIIGQKLATWWLTGASLFSGALWAGTPVDNLLSLFSLSSHLNVVEIFDSLGDTFIGLFQAAVFEYEMFEGHSGAAEYAVAVLRLGMSMLSGNLLLAIVQAIFQSGIFQSTAGIALVLGSVGIATIVSSLT